MAVKAKNFKNWCEENISPQSWKRVVLKSLDHIRKEGMSMKDFEEPSDSLELTGDLYVVFSASLKELYEVSIDQEVLT